MSIKIAQRLHPFSHLPGTSCVLPKSDWFVQVYPTRFVLKNQKEGEIEVNLSLNGPFKQFTVELDLEAGMIRIFGFCRDTYFRFSIFKEERGIVLYFEKLPCNQLDVHLSFKTDAPQEKTLVVEKKDSLLLAKNCRSLIKKPLERLSLGSHKRQDWDLISRRRDIKEIFPIWHCLGQWLHSHPSKEDPNFENFQLLKQCEELIKEKKKLEIEEAFLKLFQAGFFGILSPRPFDDHFQGLFQKEIPSTHFQKGDEESPSSLTLLHQGSSLIRSLFVQEKNHCLQILPCVPPSIHCGRLINLNCFQGDLIDIEWSKKLLRKMIWRSHSTKEVSLVLQKEIKTFRLRKNRKEKGEVLKADALLKLEGSQTLILDRFQK